MDLQTVAQRLQHFRETTGEETFKAASYCRTTTSYNIPLMRPRMPTTCTDLELTLKIVKSKMNNLNSMT